MQSRLGKTPEYFSIVDTCLQHVDGASVDLAEDAMHEWNLVDGGNFSRAFLQKGVLKATCISLFQKAGEDIPVPVFLPRMGGSA